MNEVIELVDHLREAAIDWFPRLAASIGLLLVGWLAAVVLRWVVRRLLRGLVRILPRNANRFEASTVQLCERAESVFPVITFWFVLLLFAAAAVETLGLPILTAWMAEVFNVLPNILMALVILFGGLWAGSAFGTFTTRTLTQSRHASLVGRIAQFSIVSVAVVVGVAQLGVDLSFLTTIVAVVMAGILFAGSLAFGLGAKAVVGNILAAHYAEKIYRVGDRVEVDGVSGTVVDISDTFVLIESSMGRVAIPARIFLEQRSNLPDEDQEI